MLRPAGRHKEAEEAYGKALSAYERLVKEHPALPGYRNSLAASFVGLGNALAGKGRRERAEKAYVEAIVMYERLVAENPDSPDFRGALGCALDNLGLTLDARGDKEQALARHREAIGHQRAAFDRQPQNVQFRQYLGYNYTNLARALCALGRADEAAGAIREIMKLWPANPTELYRAACGFAQCVPIVKGNAGRRDYANEAMAALRTAVVPGWSNAAWTAQDLDLSSLHERRDYQALLLELFDRGFPADPFAR